MDDNYLTISEFAELSGFNRKTLIYYDEIGLFSPARVGENGYRYYTYRQLDFTSFIWVMREVGTPLEEIKRFAESRTPENVISLLREKKNLIDDEIRKLRQISSMIDKQVEVIDEGRAADVSRIGVAELPGEPIFLGPEADESEADPFSSFFEYCYGHDFVCMYPIGEILPWDGSGLVHPRKRRVYYRTTPAMSNGNKPAGKYVTGCGYGGYGEFEQVLERMDRFIFANGLTVCGDVYVEYPLNELCVVNPEDYLAKLSVPIK